MIVPSGEQEKAAFIEWVIGCCCNDQQERQSLYQKRRRYLLYGQDKMLMVQFNRLKSHLALLSSFLFASDQAAYSIAPPKNAPPEVAAKYLAIEDEFNDDWRDSGLANSYDQALYWSLVFDTMVIKQGWNDITDSSFSVLVEPGSFGVFNPATSDFNSQQAFVHSYVIDWDEAVERLERAGRKADIEKLQPISGGSTDLGLPGSLGQMIISATGGANLSGNITGEVNPNYEMSPSYAPRVAATMCRFDEVWVWDSEAKDFRTFQVVAGNIILSDSKKVIDAQKRMSKNLKFDSDTNLFLKHNSPFTVVTPYPIFNYFWGDCHLEDLIPLQNWSTERLDQISEILEQQVDPAKVFAGFMGLDDERAEALGGPGTWVQDQMPGAKVDRMTPTMPEDLFREFDAIGNMFMEQSGFTEIMAGRGEKNVRGRGHARELKTTGGGRVKKVAGGLEKSLVRLGDIALKLKAKNDDDPIRLDDGTEFVLAQVLGTHKHTIRIAGHSHSPLFTSETHEIATALFKANSIDREWLIRLFRPPMMDQLIHALRARIKAEQAQAQQRMAAGVVEHPNQRKRA